MHVSDLSTRVGPTGDDRSGEMSPQRAVCHTTAAGLSPPTADMSIGRMDNGRSTRSSGWGDGTYAIRKVADSSAAASDMSPGISPARW
ncbi:MAG: hypothetical protein D6738_12475 [Acidobacteria bacterium]|nr:MAG: hypothetical protein D6738_12475 [Acidobacteriota bacterium]